MQHEFTSQILKILEQDFGNQAEIIFENSPLIKYLNIKTRSAARNAKSRSSFANLYAIYVLVEDYIRGDFDNHDQYENYSGAKFTDLQKRQRQLPFGNKLQNHALNHRMNEEFKKYFPQIDFVPILRNTQTNRYWINENLLKIPVGKATVNIARILIVIINCYIEVKQQAFLSFIETGQQLKHLSQQDEHIISDFIHNMLSPNTDARMFEIVSYAILRYYYYDQIVYFGFNSEKIQSENLKLYKTGRTNTNDGGIDFVMRPIGRFFQVTETLDVKKYFLDIDKIERFPISFVIKTQEDIETIRQKLRVGAKRQYSINAIVEKYMECVEEIINIPILVARFQEAQHQGYLHLILDEILTQSRVEFNLDSLD
jgi:hypothetical protein